MMENATNPPAFPSERANVMHAGMELRDYFAAKAMLGFLCEPVDGVQEALFYEISTKTCEVLARASYALADAMLQERAK